LPKNHMEKSRRGEGPTGDPVSPNGTGKVGGGVGNRPNLKTPLKTSKWNCKKKRGGQQHPNNGDMGRGFLKGAVGSPTGHGTKKPTQPET